MQLSEICVPDYVVCGIGQASRAALLAHELAHLRRRDAGWGLLAAVLTRLFPFQPLLRIAERRLRAEAELCCDAAAVRATSDGAAFARCLLEVAERTAGACAPAWTAAMAAPHSQLLARVEAALAGGAPTPSRARISATAAAGGMVLAALACVGPGVRSGGGEESEPAGRDEASSGAPAPTGVQSRSIGYSISDNTDPTDERPVLEVWEDGELVHRASTDDPRADLVKALKGLGYVTQEEKIELAPSPSTPTVSPSEREDPSLERPQGAESPSAGEREAPMDLAPGHEVLLRIDEDGAIHGDGAVLVAGNADDFAALRGFLSGKAQAMPRAVDPRNPDLPGLPDGVLRIAASERTPFSRVLSVMMLCGTKDVFIWRLEFQVERQDGTRERISYALPVDLAHDDESPSSPPRFTIELRGEGLTLRVPPQMGEGYSSKTQRLEVLGGMVQVLARPYPDASFTIDVQPGTSYAQVASVLGTLQRAGAKNILFLGRQD